MTAKELHEAAKARVPVVVRDSYNGLRHFTRIGAILFELREDGSVYMRCRCLDRSGHSVTEVPAELVELDGQAEDGGVSVE